LTETEIEISSKPLLSFGFQFSSSKVLCPNYCDVYTSQKETEFERLTNDISRTVIGLTHEILHKILFELEDKKTSLDFDNIDKGYGPLGEFYILSSL